MSRHAVAKRRKSTGDLSQDVILGKHRRSISGQDESIVLENSGGGFLRGICALFVEGGISSKRLQIWKMKLVAFGGKVVESLATDLTHVLAADQSWLSKSMILQNWAGSRHLWFLQFRWIEDCLKDGKLLLCESYTLSGPERHGMALGGLEHCDRHGDVVLKTLEAVVETKQRSTEQKMACSDMIIDPRKVLDYVGAEETECDSTGDEIELDGLHEKLDPKDGGKHEFNENADITRHLKEMWHIYKDALGDGWRALTYKKACNRLAKLPYKLTSVQQIKNIQGLGDSVRAKVKEIMTTGHLQKLDNLLASEQVQTIRLFSSVWGIGPIHARKLYEAGCRSLQDIANDPSLTHMSKLGLKYHSDLTLRIPREEVAEVENFVIMVAENLCFGVCVRVAGSFRRGQPTCGDIDVLITHPDGRSQEGFLAKLVNKLTEIGFLSAGLNFNDNSTEGTKHQVDSFMGICKLAQNAHHRRVDIKAYPWHMYPFALLSFTGNDVLNRMLRYNARLKGFKLNDTGLYLRPSKQKNGASTNVSIPCETEQEIFEKLGFPYTEPHDRNW